MRMPLTRLENNVLTIIITPLTLSPLCLLLLVRLGDYLCVLYFYKLIGKLTTFCSFRSSDCEIYQWLVPLPLCDVFLTTQVNYGEHSRQDYNTTDSFEYRRHTFNITITHSPITLGNLSFINLVSIFGCSSPPLNTVYVRCVDLSSLTYSLSSHRHSNISLFFNSHFIVS